MARLALISRRTPRPFDLALPLLRRRTTWLLSHLDARTRAFVRLLPLLLTARFRRPSFDAEPPGVRFPPRRRRWGKLCEAVDLPPPSSVGVAHARVQSVVLAPKVGGRLEVLFLLAADVPPAELPRIMARLTAIAALAQRQSPTLDVRLASPSEMHPSLLAWAAVCAGDVPPIAEGALDRLELVARAPTPTARCLALLIDDPRHPVEIARAGRAPSAPEAFAAHCSKDPLARASLACDRSTLEDVRTIGRSVRSACIAALRRAPIAHRGPLRTLLRDELFTSSLPGAFRAAFERLIAGRKPFERRTPTGWSLTLHDVELAHGETLEHLRAAAIAQSPLLAHPEAPWPRLAQLTQSAQRRNLLMVESGLQRHLVVSFSRSGRPHARRVNAEGLLRFALRSRVTGVTCEVIAGLGSEQTLVNRIAQIAALPTDGPVAIEVGNRVLLADAHRIRSLPLRSALARPRQLTWLPSDPELLRSLRRPSGAPLPTVHATAWPLPEARAAVIFIDAQGRLMRDEVDRSALEPWLVESRELLRSASPPTLMSVTVHPLLAALSGRRLDATNLVHVDVEAGPRGLRVWLDSEVFCADSELSWTALTEAVLSHWPPGTTGRVGVRHLSFNVAGFVGEPLQILAVRSRVLRRLAVGLRRLTGALAA